MTDTEKGRPAGGGPRTLATSIVTPDGRVVTRETVRNSYEAMLLDTADRNAQLAKASLDANVKRRVMELPHAIRVKLKEDPNRPPRKPDEHLVDPNTLEGKDLALYKSLPIEDRDYFGYFKWINDQRSTPDQFSVPAQEQKRAEVATGMRAKLMKLADLENMTPATPLIKGVLGLDSESWLIGQSGGFKSFVAVDWACHVSAGLPEWRGHKVTSGDVLYVAAEGARGLRKRVKAWASKHGVQPERLMVLAMPVQASDGLAYGVGVEWQELVALAGEHKPSLIVLDTQARMTAGLEENSAKDMGIWVKAVAMLREATGACVLVVHHTGRNGGDARGSSAIDAAQDMEWKVERKPHQLQAVLKCDKSKDGDDRLRFTFAMDVVVVGQDEDGQDVTSLVPGDELEAFEAGQSGISVLDTIATEGESLTNQEWITRTLDVSEPAMDGITQAELRRLVNGARKQASVEPLNENTLKSTIKRMLDGGQLFKRGQKVSLTDPAEDAE